VKLSNICEYLVGSSNQSLWRSEMMIDSFDDVVRCDVIDRCIENEISGFIFAYIYTHAQMHDQIMPQKWRPMWGSNEI